MKKINEEGAKKLIQYGSKDVKHLAIKQIKDKKGVYRKQKDTYSDKIIDYPDSPTGKAYIGINKLPLMPNDNGIGFKGVVLQDDDRRFIQCCGCGKWAKKIVSSHIQTCLGISTFEYKERFELNRTQGLVSDETSLNCTQAALKNKKSGERMKKYNKEYREKHGHHPHYVKNGIKYRIQRFNETNNGNCPEQLKTRLYEFIRCNRELPNSHNRGSSIYKALYKRFGSLGKAFKHMGLPEFIRVGTNYHLIFEDGTNYKFNINKFGEREEMYKVLMSRCSVLKNSQT